MKRRAALLLSMVLLLSCTHPTDKTHYVALGASDAFGIGAVPLSNGYPYLIRDTLDVQLYDIGVPGATANQILFELVPAVACKPKIVTLWTGANDVCRGREAEEFEVDLDAILSSLRSIAPEAKVYVGTLPDLFLLPKYGEHPDPDVTPERVSAFNAIISCKIEEHGATLVDLSGPELTDPKYLFWDKFHPNNEGHREIADRFLKEMR